MPNASIAGLQGVTEKLALARDQAVVGVADAVNSGVAAAREMKDTLGQGVDSVLDSGRDLFDDATETIRSRPWITVGVALAAGYLFAKTLRH